MKSAYQAVLCQLLQGNILTKIFKNVISRGLDSAKMKLFQRISNSGNRT